MAGLAYVLMAIGIVGFLGYPVHFVWASFHTTGDTSQSTALLDKGAALEPSRYTPRGRQLLRRMWISLGVGLVFFVVGLAIQMARGR